MNRFAALIDRLAAADGEAQHRLLADYFANAADADRDAAAAILAGKLKPRRVALGLVRGLVDARVDSVLFDLSREHVGDVAETIALVWPAARGANREPSPGEVVEALSGLGRSELPKRITAWLDAADANGRWALIKLASGTLPSPVTAEQVGHALAAAGAEAPPARESVAPAEAQRDMFRAPPTIAPPGEINAVLMYVEFGRSRASPAVCTFGVWTGDAIAPIGKAALAVAGHDAARFHAFVGANTVNRFGPVLEITHEPGVGLVLEVAFASLERAPRRKAGVALVDPRITRVRWDKPPVEAAQVDALERFLSAPP